MTICIPQLPHAATKLWHTEHSREYSKKKMTLSHQIRVVMPHNGGLQARGQSWTNDQVKTVKRWQQTLTGGGGRREMGIKNLIP